MVEAGVKAFVFAAVLLALIPSEIQCQSEEDRVNYFVDPSIRFVQLEGWGTSLAWFGDLLGGMDEDVIKEITTALFSVLWLQLNSKYLTLNFSF